MVRVRLRDVHAGLYVNGQRVLLASGRSPIDTLHAAVRSAR
jgi:hypothetical protein